MIRGASFKEAARNHMSFVSMPSTELLVPFMTNRNCCGAGTSGILRGAN